MLCRYCAMGPMWPCEKLPADGGNPCVTPLCTAVDALTAAPRAASMLRMAGRMLAVSPPATSFPTAM